MRAEVRRIQNVIEDYLRFARSPKPQRRPMELNSLLDQKLTFLNGEFEKARVKLHTHFDPCASSTPTRSNCGRPCLILFANGLDAMPDVVSSSVSTWREGAKDVSG